MEPSSKKDIELKIEENFKSDIEQALIKEFLDLIRDDNKFKTKDVVSFFKALKPERVTDHSYIAIKGPLDKLKQTFSSIPDSLVRALTCKLYNIKENDTNFSFLKDYVNNHIINMCFCTVSTTGNNIHFSRFTLNHNMNYFIDKDHKYYVNHLLQAKITVIILKFLLKQINKNETFLQPVKADVLIQNGSFIDHFVYLSNKSYQGFLISISDRRISFSNYKYI